MTCGYLYLEGTGDVTFVAMSDDLASVRAAEVRAGRWELTGAGDLAGFNDYLGYVADRGYSPRTVRAYAFDLLHFARWLAADGTGLDTVGTDALLRYLAANRSAQRDGQPENVIPLSRGSAAGFAPATINRRMAAISGLFGFRSMRDPDAVNPVPTGAAARRAARRRANRVARSSGTAEAEVAAEGPRAAAAAARPGPCGDRRAGGQLPD